MKTFKIGDIVYPNWFPEADTRCKVVAVEGDLLKAFSYDGREIAEAADCFIHEGE
jgi:hypothetical protein